MGLSMSGLVTDESVPSYMVLCPSIHGLYLPSVYVRQMLYVLVPVGLLFYNKVLKTCNNRSFKGLELADGLWLICCRGKNFSVLTDKNCSKEFQQEM